MIFAGIVAGGSGTRLKSSAIPKQFVEINGIPIIIRTINAFLNCKRIDSIYIGIKPDWHEYTEKLIEKYELPEKKIRVIDGGATRHDTVIAITDNIIGEYGCNNGDIILTHDAVRPFVSDRIISDNIETALKYKACGTYIPAVDTVIRSSDGITADETLKRDELFQAQTPQTFDIGVLNFCRQKFKPDKLNSLTDTCGLFTACGIGIKMVKGSPENFKITTDYDLKIAEMISTKFL